MRVDINCDMGESFGAYRIGEDEKVILHITSANIACGYHAGDPVVMGKTVVLARLNGVAVGVHPGYPDLLGYGRRHMETLPGEIKHYILYQMGALEAFARAEGVALQHVKPHGALYNLAAKDERVAREVIEAIKVYNPELILVALAGSVVARLAASEGLRVAQEAFPDRGYMSDGRLASRLTPGALIQDETLVAERAVKMVMKGKVTSVDGVEIDLQPDTLCIHGDTPGAWRIAEAVRRSLEASGILVIAMGAG